MENQVDANKSVFNSSVISNYHFWFLACHDKKTRIVSVRKWLNWVEELSDVLRVESVLFGYGFEFISDIFSAVQNLKTSRRWYSAQRPMINRLSLHQNRFRAPKKHLSSFLTCRNPAPNAKIRRTCASDATCLAIERWEILSSTALTTTSSHG